ncbi:MAG: S49 family peptidase [Thermodesulfobacteriota bacterium]
MAKNKPVNLLDLVQDRAWAIYPGKLEEVNARIVQLLEGQTALPPEYRAELEAQARTGMAGDEDDGPAYEVRNGVALIPVRGTLMKRANLFTRFSGGTSYDLLQRDLAEALGDPAVDALLLPIDSPGGTADGVTELARWLREQRGRKRMIGYADGLMASAAYYLGSAVDEVVAAESALVGSIGVVLAHYDYSGAYEKIGVKTTFLHAGAYKVAGNETEALSEEARTYLQGIVDGYYRLFVDDVAASRPLSAEAARNTEARVYLGAQAVAEGLADRVGTLQDAFDLARKRTLFAMGGTAMRSTAELKEKNPELYEAVFAEGRAAAQAQSTQAAEQAAAAATAAERERCLKIFRADADRTVTAEAMEKGTDLAAFFEAAHAAEKAAKAKGLEDLGRRWARARRWPGRRRPRGAPRRRPTSWRR